LKCPLVGTKDETKINLEFFRVGKPWFPLLRN